MGIQRVLAYLVLSLTLAVSAANAGHLVDTADYPYWRELAAGSPFYGAMKSDAIQQALHGTTTRQVMGGAALAYILDPDRQALYVDIVKTSFEERIAPLKIGDSAVRSSVASHQLFHALLALDVVRADLDPETLRGYEALLRDKIMRLTLGKWDPHAWAMRTLWYRYADDPEKFAQAKREFDIGLSEHYMPGDGVSPAGAGYCVERWNSAERIAKNTTLNLLEYMGYPGYFSDPGIVGLKEFMYGYAVSPFGRVLLFGDSRNTETQKPWYFEADQTLATPHVLSAARFSPEAYRSAMWVLREGAGVDAVKLSGTLTNYLVMAGSAADREPITFDLNDAAMAPSRLFKNFAALKSNVPSTDALYLGMQNLTGNTEYHTGYETNAVALAGYGEVLLRNSGYDGPGRDATVDGVTATFDFIHRDSESSNTLTVGGVRHASKTGNGITEGLLGQAVEYFRGESDEAIAGRHFRDVLLVQPDGPTHGYYLVMDHVTTDQPDNRVNVAWHPNAPAFNVLAPGMHYVSPIQPESPDRGPRRYSDNQVALTTFFATPPAEVEQKTTVNQVRGFSYVADYLLAHYQPSGQRRDILTVLFPADQDHRVGPLERIETGTYTGCQITQGPVQDSALVSDGQTLGQREGVKFQGENVLYRTEADRFVSFFVRGTRFDHGASARRGFQSDRPIAIYLEPAAEATGWRGAMTSGGAEVVFHKPNIQSVILEAQDHKKAARVLASGDGWIRVQVPAGTFRVAIETR